MGVTVQDRTHAQTDFDLKVNEAEEAKMVDEPVCPSPSTRKRSRSGSMCGISSSAKKLKLPISPPRVNKRKYPTNFEEKPNKRRKIDDELSQVMFLLIKSHLL